MDILKNKIECFKGVIFDLYSAEIYKNHKGDTILLVFSTNIMYLIDLTRREVKAAINYKDIRSVTLESFDKIRITFNHEMNGVINYIYLFYFIYY
jgi:hypothetical protein